MTIGRLAELGLAPEVIPLVTLADLLGVPVALLLDEAIQGELRLCVAWSIGRFELDPHPKRKHTLPDGSTFEAHDKFELFDHYPGETPAFYVPIGTVEGGSDVLYRLLSPHGAVQLLTGVHTFTNGGALDNVRDSLALSLTDLLVTWAEVDRRGWAGAIGFGSVTGAPSIEATGPGAREGDTAPNEAPSERDEKAPRTHRHQIRTRDTFIRGLVGMLQEQRPDLSHASIARAVIDRTGDARSAKYLADLLGEIIKADEGAPK